MAENGRERKGHPRQSQKRYKPRYRHAQGKQWIEVRVREPQQLFDARDPAPFREKDLDDDFVDYVRTSAHEFSLSTPIKIVIHIEGEETAELSRESIREAIHGFFLHEVEQKTSELRRFRRRSQIFLLIGLAVLVACIAVARSIPYSSSSDFLGALREGVVIFGWVSLWKPIELLLFDWYPLYENLRFERKLFSAEVDLRFGTPRRRAPVPA